LPSGVRLTLATEVDVVPSKGVQVGCIEVLLRADAHQVPANKDAATDDWPGQSKGDCRHDDCEPVTPHYPKNKSRHGQDQTHDHASNRQIA
jgi:hypothetical protein